MASAQSDIFGQGSKPEMISDVDVVNVDTFSNCVIEVLFVFFISHA